MKRAAEKSRQTGSASSKKKAPAPVEKAHEATLAITIAAPVDRAFAAWKDPQIREKWLPHTPLTVRKATPHKSIRIIWRDGTALSVNFWPKGSLKCEVVPHHGPFSTLEAAAKMRAFWEEKLEALRAWLENK